MRRNDPTVASGLVDPGSFRSTVDGLTSRDPLTWPSYTDALRDATERSDVDEAVAVGAATIGGHPVEVALFAFEFLGGSMGEVAGERIARAMEGAAERGVPFVLRTATGGARMQEGMTSLVQMPKLVAARKSLVAATRPFIVVLGNPTTGGVLASIAALADVTVAEDDATIGFAGPRLVERFTGRRLAPDSHTATAAYERGLVDRVLPRSEIGSFVARVLDLLAPAPATSRGVGTTEGSARDRVDRAPDERAWDVVRAARRPERPTARELIGAACDDAVFLRGDRAGSPAPGVATALVRCGSLPALAIGTERDVALRPGDFRAARRCVEIARRLDLPIVTIVDTPGADPSEASEAGGVAWSIAALFDAMLDATVPTLAVITGEGGSGGGLAFATADRVIAYDDAFFSVTTPEAAAEILWRDATRAAEAAALLKLTGHDLVDLGIADEVLAGPVDATSLRDVLAYHLPLLLRTIRSNDELVAERRRRWRR